jgi:hypothetical protein
MTYYARTEGVVAGSDFEIAEARVLLTRKRSISHRKQEVKIWCL